MEGLKKSSVSKPGELSEGEIEENVKAILEDDDVKAILNEIGITKGEAYQELASKKFILPKKNEDEVGYAKRFIKFQVVNILMSKYNEKIHDDTSEKAREAWKKFALDHNTNMRRGDADAIIAMIENEYLLPSKDGKTAKLLTQKQRDIIVRKLKEGVNSIEEILEEIEFEDEYDDKEVDPLGEELEDINEDKDFEKVDSRDDYDDRDSREELEDDEISDEEPEQEEENGISDEDNEQEVDDDFGEQEQDEEVEEQDAKTMESYGFKKARETEKYDVISKNPQLKTEEYVNSTYYIPPVGSTIENIAEEIMEYQRNNPGEKFIVIFNDIPIDPQKVNSPAKLVEDFNKEWESRSQTSDLLKNLVKEQQQVVTSKEMLEEKRRAIDNATREILSNPDASPSIQGNLERIAEEGYQKGIIEPPSKEVKELDNNNRDEFEEDDGR